MLKIFLNIKKKKLIEKARNLRNEIEKYSSLDCGVYLDYYLNPKIKEKKEFNLVMNELSKIDSNCPKFRYETEQVSMKNHVHNPFLEN